MKKIKFYAMSKEAELIVPPPRPAVSYIPQWYKDLRVTEGPKEFMGGSISNKTVKSCLPFFDAMTAGYIQETWCDIEIVRSQGGGAEFHYSHGPEIINVRQIKHVNVPNSFYNAEFLWNMPWMPKTEDKYSCLFVHPLNNMDLPFQSTSGVIDSDLFYTSVLTGGGYPFYIKKDFEGTIPAGTPMYQIIPVKRDIWKSSVETYNEEENYKNNYKVHKVFLGGYKKFFHQKKKYL